MHGLFGILIVVGVVVLGLYHYLFEVSTKSLEEDLKNTPRVTNVFVLLFLFGKYCVIISLCVFLIWFLSGIIASHPTPK